MDTMKGAQARCNTRAIAWYTALMRWSCLVIGVALVFRHGSVSPYEGAIATAGVMCAYFAGVLSVMNVEPQPKEDDAN